MTLADILARTSESHALIERTVVADLCGLAYHNARAVVDDKSLADGRARVDLDTREEAGNLADKTGKKKELVPVKRT